MTLRRRIALVTAAVLLPTVLAIFAWDAHDQRLAAERELMAFTEGLLVVPGWLAECEANPESWRGGPPPGPPITRRSNRSRPRPAASPPPARPDRRRAAPDSPEGAAPADSSPSAGAPPPGDPPPGRPAAGGFPSSGPPSAGPGRVGGPSVIPVAHSEPARFFAYAADGRPLHPDAPALPADLPEGPSALDAPLGSPYVRITLTTASPICARIVAQGTTEPWLGGVLPATHVWLLPLVAVIAAVLLAVGPVVRRIRRLTHAVQRSVDAGYTARVGDVGRDEIGVLARAFDDAAAQVRAQLDETRRRETALRDFVANTTHDVMIPLTVLQGHLAALEAAPDREALRGAMREAHYLGALIHNLGVSARLDSDDGAVSADPVDLTALVERVVARHRPIARGQGMNLESAVPPGALRVAGDVTLLEQAVGNLVDNAIRYGRGNVAVVLDRAPGGFSLSVIDDGPGIEPGAIEKVLARGGRGDAARSRAPQGRGLGLHITARVAERHGLALRFERPEDGGLRVELAPMDPARGGLAG